MNPYNRIQLCAFLLMVAFGSYSRAAIISKTLYINRGVFTTVNNTTFPCLAFNSSKNFDALNAVITLSSNDLLVLTVVNNDISTHGFTVEGLSAFGPAINPGDSITDTLSFTAAAIYIFTDNFQYPENRYMGLGGMICVSNNAGSKKFYWNLKEHQTGFNNSINNGIAVNWQFYDPDYFTINGKSFPDLQNDSSARVKGNVGDTIHIFLVNTGQSTHSVHFHGFHCRALYSSLSSQQTNWVKDTWSVKSMEGYILEMVPDKAGEYSVHDHNLVAVSGGGIHPNGMFMIMKIQ